MATELHRELYAVLEYDYIEIIYLGHSRSALEPRSHFEDQILKQCGPEYFLEGLITVGSALDGDFFVIVFSVIDCGEVAPVTLLYLVRRAFLVYVEQPDIELKPVVVYF